MSKEIDLVAKKKDALHRELDNIIDRIESTCDVGLKDVIYYELLGAYVPLDRTFLERDFSRLREIITKLLWEK